MDNIPHTFQSYINKITRKAGYLDKYGGSVIVTLITLMIFFIIFSYFQVMNKIKPIKADWVNQRCNPEVMPFAGLINPPPGESALEFTASNFNYCIQTILSNIIGFFLQPIYYALDLITELWTELLKAMNMIRNIVAYVRTRFQGIISDIFAKIFNILIPVQVITIKLKDVLAKSVGVLTTSLYTVMTYYLSLKSFLGAFLEILTLALVLLAAATIILWILPFTWPLAGAMTALFVAVSIPLAIVGITLGNVLNITSSNNIPNSPACFDGNTTLKLKKRGYAKISNIKPGNTLYDGSKVTAVFKISTYGHQMYKINNLIISGSHKIHYEGMGWIEVRKHPDAELIENYCQPYIYCINTTSKRIRIGTHLLLDWDDMDDLDFAELKNLASNFISFNASTKQIHANLEGGFSKTTMIELDDGRRINIADIKVNDQLRFGERVLGIVEIDTRNIKNIYEYKIRTETFIGGPNLWINDDDLGKFSTLSMDSNKTVLAHKPVKLYQILTDTGNFTINGVKFMDYNSAIEQIMGDAWSEKESLFSL